MKVSLQAINVPEGMTMKICEYTTIMYREIGVENYRYLLSAKVEGYEQDYTLFYEGAAMHENGMLDVSKLDFKVPEEE